MTGQNAATPRPRQGTASGTNNHERNQSMSIIPFEYEGRQMRFLADDLGNPEVIAADLARALGHVDATHMLRSIDDDEKGLRLTETPGGEQQMTVLTEAGMYQAILQRQTGRMVDSTQKAAVKAFQRWVTHEVIPSIRKTGGYGVQQLTGKELLAAALVEANATLADREASLALKDQQIAELEPKAEYVDTFVAGEDLRILRNVAKSVDMQEKELRDLLIKHHWIYREEQTRWSSSQGKKVTEYRYSPCADKRSYFRPVPNHEAPRFRGEVMHTLKVTSAGALAISRAVKHWTVGLEVAA
jgi:anti-repressor protein